MMGAVTKGLCVIQESATCALGTPRAAAMLATCSTTRRSASASDTYRVYSVLIGLCPLGFFIPGARQASLASGLQGSTPIP